MDTEDKSKQTTDEYEKKAKEAMDKVTDDQPPEVKERVDKVKNAVDKIIDSTKNTLS